VVFGNCSIICVKRISVADSGLWPAFVTAILSQNKFACDSLLQKCGLFIPRSQLKSPLDSESQFPQLMEIVNSLGEG
jgi:hypothetical protein